MIKQTPELKAEARLLLNLGYSLRGVGRELGVNQKTVHRWFNNAYNQKHQEQARDYNRRTGYSRVWYAKNKDKWSGYASQDPSVHRERQNKRRAQAYSTRIDEDRDAIVALYKECRRISEETGVMHHVDHIVPLSKGGSHTIDNLQILTAAENLAKGSKL